MTRALRQVAATRHLLTKILISRQPPDGGRGLVGDLHQFSPKQRSQAASFLPSGETLKKLKPGDFIICNTL